MSWTRGQSSNLNQSPYKDPMKDERNTPISPNYKPTNNNNRRDTNPRPTQTTQPSQQGNVRDIVASFSQEGLQTFSTIFSSSVEAAIAKTLPDLVEKAIEKKMKQVVDEALQNVNDLITQFLSHIILNTQTAIEKRLDELIGNEKAARSMGGATVVDERDGEDYAAVPVATSDEPTVDNTPEPLVDSIVGTIQEVGEDHDAVVESAVMQPAPVVADKSRDKQVGNRALHEFETVRDILSQLGRPVSAEELRQTAKDVEWGNNFTVKMNRFIQKSDGKIERVGKGLYQIKD